MEDLPKISCPTKMTMKKNVMPKIMMKRFVKLKVMVKKKT